MIIKKYLNNLELCEYTTLSRSSIYKLMKEADFPQPYEIKSIGKRVFWNIDEVDNWLSNNIQKSIYY